MADRFENKNAPGANADDKAPVKRYVDPVRAQWRRELRAARAAMPDRAARERSLAEHVWLWLAQARVQRLGFFWPTRAEPDLAPLIERWLAQDCTRQAALPVIEADILRFAPWIPGMALERGPFDVLVPPTSERIVPQALLIPCVGIDRQRFRLGYGGGYYDRTLALMQPRPYTVGIGFDCACLESMAPKPHDHQLDAAITESGIW